MGTARDDMVFPSIYPLSAIPSNSSIPLNSAMLRVAEPAADASQVKLQPPNKRKPGAVAGFALSRAVKRGRAQLSGR